MLDYDGFPGVQTENKKSWGLSEIKPFICSGGKLLLSLSLSRNTPDSQKKQQGFAVIWVSLAPVV